jgi:hypothetical protein
MASNETIQSLATLLGALRGFNQPRREMEMYAKKALIDFDIQKKLLDLKKGEDEYLKKEAATKTGLTESFNILQGIASGEIEQETQEEMEAKRKGFDWEDWGVIGSTVKGAGKLLFKYDPDVGYRINNVSEYVAQPAIQAHINNVVTGTSVADPAMKESIMNYKQYLENIDLQKAPSEQVGQVNSLLHIFNNYLSAK